MAEKIEILRIEIDQEAANKEIVDLEQNLVRLRTEQAKYKKELKDSNGQNREAATKLAAVNNEIKKNTDSRRQAIKVMNTESNSLNSIKARIGELIKSRNSLDISTAKGRAEFARLNREILKHNTVVKKAEAAGGNFQRNVGNYPKLLSGITTRLIGMVGGFYALIRVLGSAFKVIKDFDEAQSGLAAVIGKTREEIQGLTKDAIDFGKSTTFTSSQVTFLQTELAKLGFTVDEIQASTPGILRFAEATGADLGSSAKIAGAALRALNLSAGEMDRVVSVLAVSTTKSALAWQDFSTVISTVFPVARAFGFTIEETTALLGKLRDAGFDASQAGTATRNILLNLANANGALAKRLGGSVSSFEELIPALVKLRNEGVDLNETLQLTDKRSVAAFNQFLAGAEAAKKLAEGLVDVNGELTAMVDVKLDTLAGDTKRLSSAWEGFILSIDEGNGILGKAIRGLIQYGTNLLTIISDENTSAIRKFLAVFKGIGQGAILQRIENDKLLEQQKQKERANKIEIEAQEVLADKTGKMVQGLRDAVQAFGEDSEAGKFYAAVLTRVNGVLTEQADAEAKLAGERRKRAEEQAELDKKEADRLRKLQEEQDAFNDKYLSAVARRIGEQADAKQKESDISLDLFESELQDKQQVEDEMTRIAWAAARERVEIDKWEKEMLQQSTASLLGAIGDLFEKDSVQYKIFKSAEALISTYTAINKTLAEPLLPFPSNVITAAALGVQGLANVAKINSIQFAEGGKIGNRGIKLKPDKKGDNRLIIAKDSEVILNSRQQARIGAENLKRAGIPGYADGGYIGSMAGQSIMREVENTSNVIESIRNMPAPEVSVVEFRRVARKVDVKERVQQA